MAINKVVYGNSTLIDLTEDTVSADKLLAGETAHDRSGASIVGSVVTAEVVDNLITQDSTKALSANQGYVLNQNKVDKVAGKGLSTNDYTNEDKTKLAGIGAGAEPNVQSDWKQSDSSSDDFIKNKPTSDVQTSDDGQFTTVTGGLMQSCLVDLEPIQSGSGVPSPSNVRAISGHTQVKVGNVGKNKLQNTKSGTRELNGLKITSNPDGSVFFHGGYTASVLTPYDLSTTQDIPNGSYILNGCPSGGGESTFQFSVNDKADTSLVNTFIDFGFGVNVTISNGGVFRPRVVVKQGYTIPSSGLLFKPMLRLATDTDATFEPYNGYTTTINLGGTYYGGTLDAVSGVLTLDRKFKEFDGTEAWGVSGTNGFVITRTNAGINDVLVAGTKQTPMISNMFPNGSNINVWTNGYIGIDVGTIWIGDTNFAQFTDLATFKTFLSNNHLQIVYPLATPITIQLTPTQLETLVGQNNVFAPLEGQTVEEVEFREVLAIDDVPKAIPYESVSPDVGTGEMFTYFKIHRYGRVVVFTFMQSSAIEIVEQATRKIFGVLPERFYTKISGAMPYDTIKYTFINQNRFGVFVPKLLEIDPTNGNVYADYEADEGICPMGSLTYILDHD